MHLHDAHQRVMSIATLQKQLAMKSADKVELSKYLRDLCASIGASMIDDPSRITLVSRADGTVINANVSVSLGLIVTELVMNALKHAFPGRNQNGLIEVDYSSSDAGWTLTVGDNGDGMAAESDSKPGLGTGIVQPPTSGPHPRSTAAGDGSAGCAIGWGRLIFWSMRDAAKRRSPMCYWSISRRGCRRARSPVISS